MRREAADHDDNVARGTDVPGSRFDQARADSRR
jgi:hypothetical protein